MMFSKSMLAAGLAVMSSLAIASPIQGISLHERQAIAKDKAPTYCQVADNTRAGIPYVYVDLSEDCDMAGLGNKCCMTVFEDAHKAAMTDRDLNDLKAVIAAQSKKTGKFATSTIGDWKAGFGGVFQPHDQINSKLLQVWYNALNTDINLANTGTLSSIIFQIRQGTDDVSNFMRIDRG